MSIRAGEARSFASLAATRRTVSEALWERLPEIVESVFLRVRAIAEPDRTPDPEYLAGMQAAVAEALEYSIGAIEEGASAGDPVPTAAIAQARRSARAEIPLDIVMRRYAAGDRLLAEFIMECAAAVPGDALREILRMQGARADFVMAGIATEYQREATRIRRSPTQKLGERVRSLLAGEADSHPGVAYELDAWHLGLIAIGERAEEALQTLAKQLDAELLMVPADEEGDSIWAWLGRQGRPETAAAVTAWNGSEVAVAMGEPRQGIDGWRLTHDEALAALQVLLMGADGMVCARDVFVAAAVLRDDALANALVETYLAPLCGRGEADLRETLRAYFSAGQNAATAAAALDVNRHTVERRIRAIEERIGQPLNGCRAQMEVALEVEALRSSAAT